MRQSNITSSLLRPLQRLLPSLGAVVVCLLGAMLTLAVLRFDHSPGSEEPRPTVVQEFGQLVGTVWERSVLPGTRYDADGQAIPGSRCRNWVKILQDATPLLLTGLAVTVAFRASVLNIGAEGQFLAGAIGATAVGVTWTGPLPLPLLLVAAAAGGALLAVGAALLDQWRRVPVVLSTLLLNFVAMEAVTIALTGPLQGHDQELKSDPLPLLARLPQFWPAEGARLRLHAGAIVALVVAGLLAVVLRRTTFGFRLRAVGENAEAARFAGIPVGRVATLTLALSGALAGLAGGVQVAGIVPYQLLDSMRGDGLGFAGIAVALLGRLSVGGVLLAAVFFGWLRTAFGALESYHQVPAITLQATQGTILIAMLILSQLDLRRLLARGLGPRPLSNNLQSL